MKPQRVIKLAIISSEMLIITIATASMVDSLVFGDVGFNSWGGGGVMALPSAACFILLGSVCVLQSMLLNRVVEKLERKNG